MQTNTLIPAKENHLNPLSHDFSRYINLELARKRAASTRWKSVNYLDRYLIEFEANWVRNGGKITWAVDNHNAAAEIINIIGRIKPSFPAQELVAKINMLSVEEIFGATAMEGVVKSFFDVADKLDDIEVCNARFFAADPGVVMVEKTSALSKKIKIVLASVDRVTPSINDFDLLSELYNTYSSSNPSFSILSAPGKKVEAGGIGDIYIVLVDNSNSSVLSHIPQRQILTCIDCGACIRASSICNTATGAAFPGPAKAVSTPLAFDTLKYKYLADFTTMDGSGSEVCPVRINFSRLTLHNRKYFVENGFVSRNEKWFFYAWKKAMLKRDIISWTKINAGKKVTESYYRSKDGLRKMPASASKTFNQQWREKMGYR